MKRQLLVLAGLLILAVLAGAVWLGMREPAPVPAAPQPQAQAATQPAPAAQPRTPARPADTSLPPWAATAPSVSPATVPPPAAAVTGSTDASRREQQMRELELMQAELAKSMRSGGQVDPRQVDAALAKLQQVTGTSQVGGINIDAVRNNLHKAMEMQAIAAEMDREAKKPGGADITRIRGYADQLQKLQSQLRTDITVGAATLPATKPQ